jgi:peptide/nickel transport system ATP-binding protein
VTDPLLSVNGLCKTFRSGPRTVVALSDVSLSLQPGETLGLVGASGSGKSTLARVLTRLIAPDAGQIAFSGDDWLSLTGADLRRKRRAMQMVFQDTLGAFNPRATVASVIDDPLRIHDIVERGRRPADIARLLERVELSPKLADRSILDLSGGQRQRVAIARALATRPQLIVLDEAVSALDVSVRGKILALLADLQRASGIAYIFVSHDLAVVRVIAHRVAVMEQGAIVETGTATGVVENPQSPAAKALVAAVPRLHIAADPSQPQDHPLHAD